MMENEVLGVAIIWISITVAAVIFACLAVYHNKRYRYDNTIKGVGELIGFRVIETDYEGVAIDVITDDMIYTDYDRYVTNSKPIIKFRDNDGGMVEINTEWSTDKYGKGDIGKEVAIRYKKSCWGKYRVVIDSEDMWKRIQRGRRMGVVIYMSIAIFLFLIAILAMITFA